MLANERGGTQLVVDYKTDALAEDTDLAAFVDEHYGVQRRVYALAALRGGAARVEVAYAFLERPHEPLATRFEAADADRLHDELLALAAGMLAGQYPVTQRRTASCARAAPVAARCARIPRSARSPSARGAELLAQALCGSRRR